MLLGINDEGRPDDLPRNQEGIALVGDPRQDAHLLVSQMEVAMIKAHNLLVDRLREDGVAEADLFLEARRALTWHFQWTPLFRFLPMAIGERRLQTLLESGPRFFRPDGVVAIAFEFADAAYRFGHSQMRQIYRLQRGGEDLNLFPDLIGFRPVPSNRVIDWTLFFDVTGEPIGSLIVGEVLLGIVDGDPQSFRSLEPGWRPTLPGRSPGHFTIGELLVVPESR